MVSSFARRSGIWAAWLLLLVAFGGLSAKASAASHHFLWRVTNAPAPFYLLGSLHALRDSDYPLPDEIEHAVAASQKVTFETNPDAKDARYLRRKVFWAGDYPSGTRIDEKVRPETLQLLHQLAEVPPSVYERRRPWAIAFFNLATPGTANFQTRLSVDHYIYEKAHRRKEIGGLESVDELVKSFTSMSDAQSEAYLLDCVAFAQHGSRLLDETTSTWKTGDANRLYRLYARPRNSGYWRWIERRHSLWLPPLEAAMRTGKPTLVVAGALHFCGPRSIIAGLQARGYKIEQL
jgi:uncharacterized protein